MNKKYPSNKQMAPIDTAANDKKTAIKKAAKEAKRKGAERARKIRKIVSGSVIVAIAAITVFAGGVQPEKETTGPDKGLADSKPGIEYVIELPPEQTDIRSGDKTEKKDEKRRPKVLSLLSVPLWFFGNLLSMLLKPLLGKVLFYVLIAVLFFAIFCIILKLLFPGKSLKELLTPRNLLAYFCCTAVFIAALNIEDFLKPEGKYHGILGLALGAAALTAMVLICSGDGKDNKHEMKQS